MITSIVLTGTHKIGIDSYGKFMVGDVKVSIKEVPFVRYRFDEFTDKEFEYIEAMKKKFSHSAHMAEITIGDNTVGIVNKLKELGNIVTYVYIPIEDSDVLQDVNAEKVQALSSIAGLKIDRLMMKDKSTTLDTVAATRLKKQLSQITGIQASEIGVCSSPLSFNNGNACLTAVKARELSALYSETEEAALPSSNHECMNCCGCIRYHVFNTDVEAPVDKKKSSGGKTTSTDKKEDSDNKSKSTKKSSPKGILKWR